MAPKSPSPYSPSSSKSPLPHQSQHFPSIQEPITEEDWFHYAATPRRSNGGDIMEKDDGGATPTPNHHHRRRHHHPPPPPPPSKHQTRTRTGSKDNASVSIPCDNCRPSPQEKISAVPFEARSGPIPSPNRILRTIVSPFVTKKSPVGPQQTIIDDDRQYWKAALGELANKLVETTRSRDEALVEASRLKQSMTELENKLNRLEVYCHGLKSGLEKQSRTGTASSPGNSCTVSRKLIEQHFLTYVLEARNNIRVLSRLLGSQLPRMGLEVHEAIFAFLRSYGIEISLATTNPRNMVLYLEALLNHSFFEDFETVGFGKDAAIATILDPTERCKANFDTFKALKGMTWQGIRDKGTKHFSERFGRFCDRKMYEIGRVLEWSGEWSEDLLEGFFCASKSVWLVHLLANSVHPGFSIFRVPDRAGFDPIYMESATGSGRNARVRTSKVQIMVAPGFYVHKHMIKCKVLCRYVHNQSEIPNIKNNVGL